MNPGSLFPDSSGAVFSECGTYRYKLWRAWDISKPVLTFLMLNPSTANATENDPTVERCQRRAIALGFGGLRVANIFALRSTDPSQLYSHPAPIGYENDQAIIDLCSDAGLVICGWGKHGQLMKRGLSVLNLLRGRNIQPHYLLLNQDKSPRHPLYIGMRVKPQPFPFND